MKYSRGVFVCLAAIVLGFTTFSYAQTKQKDPEQVIKVTAKMFEFSPKEITIKKGIPVVLELTSLDRPHGFNCPELKVRADIKPGKASRVRIVAAKAGTYEFYCDVFCGVGHAEMRGKIIVVK